MNSLLPPSQAVIFCGGQGKRLRSLTGNLPKPLAPVLGRAFIEYLIEQVRDEGFQRILLLTGYEADQISHHIGGGERFGVQIRYSQGPAEWETGRRLAEAGSLLDERFLLLYADNLAPFRLRLLWQRHRSLDIPLTATVVRKERGNLRLAANGTVDLYDPGRNEPGLSHVEIGYMIVERDPILALNPDRGSFSFVLQGLARTHRFGAYEPGCAYQSISDPQRLRETEAFLRPRRLVLLDRDGVVNQKAPAGQYVSRIDGFIWISETLAGLEQLATEGFEFIILSNQAGIGRGVVSAREVDELNEWMVQELGHRGIVVRDVLVCPHHWEDQCTCRKPAPGMFFEASNRHRFSLHQTVYVGDDPRDAIAAWNAGCSCVLVGGAHGCESSPDVPPPHRAANLREAVPWLLDQFRHWESEVGKAVIGS